MAWPKLILLALKGSGRAVDLPLKNSLIKVNTRDYDLITGKSVRKSGKIGVARGAGGHLVIVFELPLTRRTPDTFFKFIRVMKQPQAHPET